MLDVLGSCHCGSNVDLTSFIWSLSEEGRAEALHFTESSSFVVMCSVSVFVRMCVSFPPPAMTTAAPVLSLKEQDSRRRGMYHFFFFLECFFMLRGGFGKGEHARGIEFTVSCCFKWWIHDYSIPEINISLTPHTLLQVMYTCMCVNVRRVSRRSSPRSWASRFGRLLLVLGRTRVTAFEFYMRPLPVS